MRRIADEEHAQANMALETLRALDNHRYSTTTGDAVTHDGTENLRLKAIAVLERYFDE